MAGYDSSLYGFGLYGEQNVLNPGNLVVEIARSGQWRDVTSSVRTDPGVSYSRGYSPDSTQLSPGSMSLTLDNRLGLFSPRYSGSLVRISQVGRNVPIRVGLGTQVVGNGNAILATSTAAPTATAPFDGNDVAATQVVAFCGLPVLNVTAPAGTTERAESDGTYSTFSISDASVAVNGNITRTFAVSPNTTDYAALNVGLPGTWTYQSASAGVAGSGNSVSVNTANGRFVFIAQAWSTDAAGLLGPPQVSGPYAPEWVAVGDSKAVAGPHIQGWWAKFPTGTYTVVCHGDLVDCDTHMALYQSSDSPEYSPRFCGVVRDWPIEWDESGQDYWVSIVAQGGLYQGRQDALPMSAARQVLGRNGTYYWPMEDDGGPGFTAATANTPRLVATTTGGTDTAPVYATSTAFVGSSPLATFLDAGARATVPALVVGTGGVECSFMMAIPSTGAGPGANLVFMEFSGGNLATYGIEYTSNTTLTQKWTYSDGTAAATSVLTTGAGTLPVGGVDGKSLVFAFSVAQNGAAITYGTNIRDVTWNNGWASTVVGVGGAASIGSVTAGNLTGVRVGLEVGTNATIINQNVTIGHIVIGPSNKVSLDLMAIAATGGSQAGYHGWPRMAATPTPAAYTAKGARYNALDSGPIVPGSAGDRLQVVGDTEQGAFVDSAGFVGVNLVDRSILQSSPAAYAFVYTSKELARPLSPVDDDQKTLNRVTVERPDPWGQASYEALAGTLGVTAVGPYSQAVFAFPNTTAGAEDLAEWIVNQGTVDAQRWPELTVEWAATTNTNLPELTIGRTIDLTTLPSFVGPSVELQIVGIRETIDSTRIRTTYITRPAEGWRVLILDDLDFGIVADASNPTAQDNRIGL